jgi:hypothetical protein
VGPRPCGSATSRGPVDPQYRGFVAFWIDVILGDGWRVAAVVGLALVASWGLVAAGMSAWWVLPTVVVAATVTSLRRTVRAERTRGQ